MAAHDDESAINPMATNALANMPCRPSLMLSLMRRSRLKTPRWQFSAKYYRLGHEMSLPSHCRKAITDFPKCNFAPPNGRDPGRASRPEIYRRLASVAESGKESGGLKNPRLPRASIARFYRLGPCFGIEVPGVQHCSVRGIFRKAERPQTLLTHPRPSKARPEDPDESALGGAAGESSSPC